MSSDFDWYSEHVRKIDKGLKAFSLLIVFLMLAGVKFILITDPKLLGIDAILRRIYELYSDYVLKNPFYALEMPIRCDLFLENLKVLFEGVEKVGSGS